MIVVFKNGERVIFNLNDRFEFEEVFYQLKKWFSRWILLGSNAVVRKEEISNIFYFPEGYSKSKESIAP